MAISPRLAISTDWIAVVLGTPEAAAAVVDEKRFSGLSGRRFALMERIAVRKDGGLGFFVWRVGGKYAVVKNAEVHQTLKGQWLRGKEILREKVKKNCE
jgi:hypothetical protein